MNHSSLTRHLRSALQPFVRPGKFAVVGVLNTLVDFSIFTALVYGLDWSAVIANIFSYSCGIVCSYHVNKRWTFRSTSRAVKGYRKFTAFCVLNMIGLTLGTITIWMFVDVTNAIIAKLLSVFVTFVWNYWTIRNFIFNSE
jgi:putative flippase GtrA